LKDKIRQAKELYERLYQTLRYGDSQLRTLSKAVIDNMLEEVRDCLVRTGADLETNPLRLPSAYHAALYLTYNQLTHAFAPAFSDTDFIHYTLGIPLDQSKTFAESFIFRGQSDCCWPPKAGIYRDDVNVEKALREQQLFSAMLQHAILHVFRFPLEEIGYLSLAQHYGLTTNLLDFTVDPSVAVYFAATGKSPPAHAICDAVVYALESRKWKSTRVNIVLPPPIGQRLYEQRGLFIVIQKSDIAALREACREIHFPRCPDFKIYRDGASFDALPGEPLLEDITHWTRRTALTSFTLPPSPAQQAFALEPHYEKLPNRTSLSRTHAEDLAERWAERSTDMLHRLFSVPDPNQPDGERVFGHLYSLGARHNVRLYRSLAVNARDVARQLSSTNPDQASSQLAFARLLEDALLE